MEPRPRQSVTSPRSNRTWAARLSFSASAGLPIPVSCSAWMRPSYATAPASCARCLWPLVFYVNWTGLRDAQKVGNTLFLAMFVRVFWGKISFWVSRLNKDHAITSSLGFIQSVEGLNETERWRKGEFALLPELGCLSLTDQCSYFLSLQNSYHWLPWSSVSLGPQLTDGRSCDFSVCIIVWANSYTESLLPISHLSPIGSASLENPDR